MATASVQNPVSIPNFNPAIASKRKEKDVMKLLMSDYRVVRNEENPHDFTVEFNGPKDSFYEGGKWSIHVILPEAYPYKSPSIGFLSKIFHPNVDESSGSVCLDVINQTWSPMFDMINIFDVFLPQLLMYPNPTDPLNPEAAALMLKEPSKYERKVKDYVNKYAKTQVAINTMVEEFQERCARKKEMDVEEEEEDEYYSEDDSVSLGEVSDLSDTSDIDLME